VLLQVWNRPIYTVGGQHLMSDALAICGARNVFADLPEAGPVVDTERSSRAIPTSSSRRRLRGGRGVARRLEAIRDSAAVRSGRLAVFEDQALSRLGPSVIDATEGLCRTIARVSRGSY